MIDFIGAKIALLYDGKVLVILRDNKPKLRFAGWWEFAGGGREGNESPEACIIREVNEELGIILEPSRIIWKKVHPAMQDPNLKAYFMVAEISEQEIQNIVFGHEGQEWKIISIDEFFESDTVIPALKDRLRLYLESK